MITPRQGVIIGAGKYRLVQPLERGGRGSAWIARHRDLEADVVVKFMDPKLVADGDLRARFEREAGLVAGLTQPARCPRL